MKSKIARMVAVLALVGFSAVPLQTAHAWPWGFNCCGISVGQSWGPGWWGGGPWGYPGYWGHPYGPWGYPGWWAPWGPPPPLAYPVILLPAPGSSS